MTVNITDSDTFTDPIVAPDDGDLANGAIFQLAPQGLANRTRYLYNRSAYASYKIQGEDVENGNKFTLVEETNGGGFVLDNNEITVPAVGAYLIAICGVLSTDSDTNPITFGMIVRHGSDYVVDCEGTRFSGNSAHVINASGVGVVDVTDTNDKIYVVASISTVTCATSLCKLVIRRLS